MAFIQIIDFTTDDIDAVLEVDKAWEAATEGKRTARRQILTRDRSDSSHYQVLVFFDSYESAMENSNLPETQEFAGKYGEVTSSIAFRDLDVVSDTGL